jgi:hypothetical protein
VQLPEADSMSDRGECPAHGASLYACNDGACEGGRDCDCDACNEARGGPPEADPGPHNRSDTRCLPTLGLLALAALVYAVLRYGVPLNSIPWGL